MVLLQYIVPTLATLLVGVLGALSPSSISGAIHYSWLTLFCAFVLTTAFDRSRGRWISFLHFAILVVFTAGLYVDQVESFLSWAACVFVASSLVVISSQLVLSTFARIGLMTFATLIVFLPAALTIHIYSSDEAAYIVPAFSITLCLLPFVLQYIKTHRPEVVWPIITLQQLVLRLAFTAWAYLWSAADKNLSVLEEYRLPLAIALGAVLLATNIRPQKLSWPHVSLSSYSLVLLFISLFKSAEMLPLIFVVIAVTAFGTTYPKQMTTGNKREKDLSLMEIGAFGSASFLVSLWSIYKMKANMETYEFVLWAAFLILASSKMWSQTQSEQIFGNSAHESSKSYYYGRIVVQATVVIYFLVLLINQKFNVLFV